MDKVIFNVDSRFRNTNVYPKPEHFSIELYETQKNIDFFRVTSIEIPNLFYIFDDNKKNNFFKIRDGSGSWNTIKISSNYYEVSDLIQEINNKFDSLFSPGLFVMEDVGTSTLKIKRTINGIFYLDFSNNSIYKSLGYNLGFRNNLYTVNNEITSESPCDIYGEPYCFLRVNDYGQVHINTFSPVKVLYKITVSDSKSKISFEDGSDLINKTHFFRQPVNLKRFEFELFDAYGNRLDNRGIDYSMTIEMGRIYDRKEYMKKLDPYTFQSN